MSEPSLSTTGADAVSHEDLHAALFAQLVLQQTNLALMLLGKIPNPQTGETLRDLDAAQVFIDQLEMLEVKTKGNLGPEEARLLQQSLMSLRMAFVEAVEAPAPSPAGGKPGSPAADAKPASPEPAASASEEESRKRFSKKY